MPLIVEAKIKHSGGSPIADAVDVEMPDGKRLSEVDLSTGRDGLTPFIGANGNWWIGEEDTGVKAQGADGANGHTPVKGTDYFTEADKLEMVSAVLAALPAAEGVSF